jgi:hypothetical protein
MNTLMYKQCLSISIVADLLEDLLDVRGVCHSLVGNTGVGVDLLEDLDDVQGVCLLSEILSLMSLH